MFWLNKYREKVLKELELIADFYSNKIAPLFANMEQEADSYSEEMFEERLNEQCFEGYELDPSDAAYEAQSASIEFYSMLSLMKYRNLALWLSCLYQAWQQQLFTFTINERTNNRFDPLTPPFPKEWHTLKDECKINYAEKLLKCVHCTELKSNDETWRKIDELRDLVNVIKHGEGHSSKKLRETHPRYFFTDLGSGSMDKLALFQSSLLDETLNISDADFKEFYDNLVKFWNELFDNVIKNSKNAY